MSFLLIFFLPFFLLQQLLKNVTSVHSKMDAVHDAVFDLFPPEGFLHDWKFVGWDDQQFFTELG